MASPLLVTRCWVGAMQSPMAPNSPWHSAAVLALGVREATVHRALLTSMTMACRSAVASKPSGSLTSASVKLALLEAIVENALALGDAAGVAAVIYHSMDVSEAQSRAVAEE